jgi:putative transposase
LNFSGLQMRRHTTPSFILEIPLQVDAVQQPVKYVRLVRRKLHGKVYFYVHLVLEGKPYRKAANTIGAGSVGLDLGPSTLAVVSEDVALFTLFCVDLDPQAAAIRRLQRQLDRQRRANNPDNYNADGTIKAGKLTWHNSNRMQETR